MFVLQSLKKTCKTFHKHKLKGKQHRGDRKNGGCTVGLESNGPIGFEVKRSQRIAISNQYDVDQMAHDSVAVLSYIFDVNCCPFQNIF